MTHCSSGTECAARRAGDRFITFAAFQIKLFISDLGFLDDNNMHCVVTRWAFVQLLY